MSSQVSANDAIWPDAQQINRCRYRCGYCRERVMSGEGWQAESQSELGPPPKMCVLICPHCNRPTYMESDYQIPPPGGQAMVAIAPPEILARLQEASDAFSVRAYTAAAILCRKILMNVAVSQAAKEGQTFAFYIEFLIQREFIPKASLPWVDKIRATGNEAAHSVAGTTETVAKQTLEFTAMLLRLVYEFPDRASQM